VKKTLGVYSAPEPHWVGNAFPVRSLFSYDNLGKQLSPFLLLDYAGPSKFPPAEEPRGVGKHPHRGFETVTIVYDGEVRHRDSSGAGGVIGPGDVQWMTAGAGIIHEEFHSQDFTRKGARSGRGRARRDIECGVRRRRRAATLGSVPAGEGACCV
jgi:redox-sensitive bicupin YhaK (pirin superfamily)